MMIMMMMLMTNKKMLKNRNKLWRKSIRVLGLH